MTESPALRALDLFAGTGWGVACQRLGIDEMGVEIMPEAIATRTANGMHTIYNDVWDGLVGPSMNYDLLIASPPCQTFSLAGKGAGRAALDEVIEAIELGAYKEPAALKAFGEKHDPRTALVLTPLAHVWRDRPRFVTMEQVPTVLPVWEACAEVMRGLGYSVKVANLQAEQYGVPQTRKRAILVARLDGEVQLPKPTHSRYYSRTPDKLDPDVKKWVSMAEALGWTRPDPAEQIFCPTNLRPHSGFRAGDLPASSLAFGHDRPRWLTTQEVADYRQDGTPADGIKLTAEEAATIQSYPAMLRSNYGSGGDPANRGERTADQPAPTLTSKADRNKWDGERNMTAPQASTLQSYERPFVWCGTKTKQFLQIGNAVPPLLAEAILSALTATEWDIADLAAEELVSA